MRRLIDQLVARRAILALLTLLLGGVVASGLARTTTDTRDTALLSEDDPIRKEVERVREEFPPSTGILFAFLPASGNVFERETLLAMDELTDRFTEVESAVSASSLMNRRLNAVDADLYDRDYLFPDLSSLRDEDLASIRRIALADEALTSSVLSSEGDMAIAFIKFKASADDQATRLRIARSALALRDSIREAHPEQAIYAIGGVLFELEGHHAQVDDSQLLFPIITFASLLLLWLCLRSFLYSFCLFSLAFATIAVTVGTVGWAQVPLNQISSMAPLVVYTIAMADGIHIVSLYVQGLHDSLGKVEAMRQSLILNLQPITLATVTTAIGFLSLNVCSSPAIYGFGNVVALGVVWAYVLTLTLLPAIVLLLPVREVPQPLGVRGFIRGVGQLVARQGNLLLGGSGVVIVATLAFLPLNKVDFDQFSFVDKDSDFHRVITALSEKIGNDRTLAFTVRSGEYYGITEPDFLQEVDELSQWLEAQPEASFVRSYTDLLKNLNQSEHDNDEAWYRLPDDKLQIIDHLVSYQLVQEIEPDLEPIFNADYSAIRLVVGTSDLTNRQLIDFNKRIDGRIEAELDPAYEVTHGDNSILFARLNRAITEELLEGFSLSIVLITGTLLIGLRSVRYGLLSLAPNLFPATIVFGAWGLLVGELSPYILMLFSISIGLVVDDSVHVLSKYISARREGRSPEAAVEYSLQKAGGPITITTATLALGTVILVFSNTFYFQNVARLLTPIIVVALLLDLLFLPPLLVKFDRWLEGAAPARPGV
jgi:predicted RND superfamily exporter protein